MTRLNVAFLAALVLASAGCNSLPSYTDVDLGQDLTPADLTRYDREWQAAQGPTPHPPAARIEQSNNWPLGILLYWRRGSVVRTDAAPAPGYHLSSTLGLGPLSILYVGETHASFKPAGQRLGCGPACA